jgi:hypothetical protein
MLSFLILPISFAKPTELDSTASYVWFSWKNQTQTELLSIWGVPTQIVELEGESDRFLVYKTHNSKYIPQTTSSNTYSSATAYGNGYNSANAYGSSQTTTTSYGGYTIDNFCTYTFIISKKSNMITKMNYEGNDCHFPANKISLNALDSMKKEKKRGYGIFYNSPNEPTQEVFRYSISKKDRDLFKSTDLSNYKKIMYVVPGSPAEKAGLKEGMYIDSIKAADSMKTNPTEFILLDQAFPIVKIFKAKTVSMSPTVMSKAFVFMNIEQRHIFGVLE